MDREGGEQTGKMVIRENDVHVWPQLYCTNHWHTSSKQQFDPQAYQGEAPEDARLKLQQCCLVFITSWRVYQLLHQ